MTDQDGNTGFETIDTGQTNTLLIVMTEPNLTYKFAPALTSQVADTLRDALGADSAPAHVIIDLGRVRLLDSSGASLIIAAHKVATAAGSELNLCCVAAHIERILELLGMTKRTRLFGSRQAALDAARLR